MLDLLFTTCPESLTFVNRSRSMSSPCGQNKESDPISPSLSAFISFWGGERGFGNLDMNGPSLKDLASVHCRFHIW